MSDYSRFDCKIDSWFVETDGLKWENFTGVGARVCYAGDRCKRKTRSYEDGKPVSEKNNPTQDGIDHQQLSQTLLRIVAQLPKTEYHLDKSNGPIRRQADEFPLDDLPDPASDNSTSQG